MPFRRNAPASSVYPLETGTFVQVQALERPLPRFLAASMATELGVLLVLSVLFPFMIHLLPVPEDARLGPRLLPMFYAPLLGALLGRKRSAFLVAAAAPWLNWGLTGHPTPASAVVTTAELVVFVGVILLLIRRYGARWFLAAPAYLACMVVAAALVAVLPGLIRGAPALPWLVQVVQTGLPGVAIMLLINWLAVRHYPTGGDGQGPAAA